jgi:hypothetical protein
LDKLIRIDTNKTCTCCIKILRHFLLVLEVLLCLVGKWLNFKTKVRYRYKGFSKMTWYVYFVLIFMISFFGLSVNVFRSKKYLKNQIKTLFEVLLSGQIDGCS